MRFLPWLLLLCATPALAQNFGNIKPHTVLGNPDPTASRPAAPLDMGRMNGGLRDLISYGGDPTGAADATAALNACLAAAGSGGTCYAGGGAFKLLGNVTIPANTTLKCGESIPDQEDAPAGPAIYGTSPRLMLDSTKTISPSGQAAKVTGCLIVRNGIVFPVPDPAGVAAYAGTAISANFGNFQLTNTVIIGFDVCAKFSSTRPLADTVYVDCVGSVGGAIWVNNLNTDGGYFTRIKAQPLGTGNWNGGPPAPGVSCAGATRPGNGIKNDGINFFGEITVNNYRGAGIWNGGSSMIAEKLWADFPPACQATYPNSIAIQNDGNLTAGEMNLNGTGIGFVANGNASVRHLFANSIGGDCVVLGTAGVANLTIFTYETNPVAAPTDKVCGGSGTGRAVSYADATRASRLTIAGGTIKNTAVSPYIYIPSNVGGDKIAISDKLATDIANPAALYGGATVVTSCTGVGTGGCALQPSSRTTPWRGTVLLSPTGTPLAGGSIQLTFPLAPVNLMTCQASLLSASALWNAAATLTLSPAAGNAAQINWANGGAALTAGSSYGVNFQCEPQ